MPADAHVHASPDALQNPLATRDPDELRARAARVSLLGLDIDGCLTDGLLYWGGPLLGWTQRYAVRDGEAILRLVRDKVAVVPISRNKTGCARARMEHLRLPLDWVGVDDKPAALAQVAARYGVDASRMAYVGDGQEDVPVLQAVGFACVPADGHPRALAAADFVTRSPGGRGAVEEIIDLLQAR